MSPYPRRTARRPPGGGVQKTPVEAPRPPWPRSPPPPRWSPTPAVAPRPPEPPVDTLALPAPDPPGIDHLARAERLRGDGRLQRRADRGAQARWPTTADDSEALTLVAGWRKASGQKSLAAQAYERLGRLDRRTRCLSCQAGADAARRRRCPSAAEALASAAMGRDDGNVEAWQALGRAQLSPGDLAGAIRSLEQARTLEPCARLGAEQPRLRLPPGQPEHRGAGGASTAPSSCSPRPRWCRTTSAWPGSAPVTRTGRRRPTPARRLLAPTYVKAQVNGAADGDGSAPTRTAGWTARTRRADGDGEE